MKHLVSHLVDFQCTTSCCRLLANFFLYCDRKLLNCNMMCHGENQSGIKAGHQNNL